MTRDIYDLFHRNEDRGCFGDRESDVRGNNGVRSDLIDLELVLHFETPAKGAVNQGAIRVSENGDDARAVLILFPAIPEAFGILMPMRAEIAGGLPAWMRPVMEAKSKKAKRRAA